MMSEIMKYSDIHDIMKIVFGDDHMRCVSENLSAGSNDEAKADPFVSDSGDENAESDCEDPFASESDAENEVSGCKDPCKSKNDESGLG